MWTVSYAAGQQMYLFNLAQMWLISIVCLCAKLTLLKLFCELF